MELPQNLCPIINKLNQTTQEQLLCPWVLWAEAAAAFAVWVLPSLPRHSPAGQNPPCLGIQRAARVPVPGKELLSLFSIPRITCEALFRGFTSSSAVCPCCCSVLHLVLLLHKNIVPFQHSEHQGEEEMPVVKLQGDAGWREHLTHNLMNILKIFFGPMPPLRPC